MPWTVDDALRLAMKRHTVEEAQRRLQQQKHGGDGKAVGAVDSEETEDTKPTRRYCDEQGTLFQQVRHLEEAVAQLQVRTGKQRIVCWQCGEGGHGTSRGTAQRRNQHGQDHGIGQIYYTCASIHERAETVSCGAW